MFGVEVDYVTGSFAIRGAAEAHAGAPWSWAARERMIRYLGELTFNLYLYAPQGDPLVRERWWEPYLSDEVDSLVDMAQVGARRGVRFCPALAPTEPDAESVLTKLRPLYVGGIRDFAFLDLPPGGAELCRRVREALPGVNLFASMAEPGELLPPEVEVLVGTRAPTVGAAEMEEVGRRLKRPPVLWDRYPGGGTPGELALRPVRGRDPHLAAAVAGVVAECAAQPEASRVALHTWASYLRNPAEYEPESAWVQALAHVAPEQAPALRLLGELTRKNHLEPAAEPLTGWADRPDLAEVRLVAWARAATALKEMPDKPLREDLKPWVNKLAVSADAGLKALQALRAVGEAEAQKRRGLALAALWRLRETGAWVAGDQVERFARECLRRC